MYCDSRWVNLYSSYFSQVSLFFWVFGPLIWPLWEFFIFCWGFFVYLSYVLHVFICARGLSENWRYCSVTSSDSVTPRRFSTTPTTRCCLGCGPTAPPTCQGTGMHPTAFIQPTRLHPDSHPATIHTHTHSRAAPRKDDCVQICLCVSINVPLMLIWDHCVADPSPLLLYIFVCLAHTC